MNSNEPQEDLIFARACAQGDVDALAEFESRLIPQLRRALLQRGLDAPTTDEALQRLRLKLFVASGEGAPKITEYNGRGPLLNWLRMAALRIAWNLGRERRHAFDLDDSKLQEAASPIDETDRRYIKERYRQDFTEVFQEALATLQPRARTLLRLHLVDGMRTSDIARAYRVDRATVKRWLADSREQLRNEVQARLASRLGMAPTALDSLLQELQSQLDLSIRTALRDPTPS